jgi:hypothetical protein
MWHWLEELSGGAAGFVGSVTGSSLGLVALLIGAMVNAHLNRRRDDRLRRDQTRSFAVALKSELKQLQAVLIQNADELDETDGP